MNNENPSAILLIHCPDKQGLINIVTGFIVNYKGNILDLDEHVDRESGTFFMRVEWALDGFELPRNEIYDCFHQEVGQPYNMEWLLYYSDQKPRMAVFVSKLSHCLYDILSRWDSGEWQVEIPLVISNHADLEPIVKKFGIDFYHIPVNKDNKQEAERRQLELLEAYQVNFVVMARYMQILTENFVNAYPNRVINIHHSFLPAFPGAKPYHSAHDRGVKIIGATSHYASAELDAGPIIEQDVTRVNHRNSVKDLVRKGRDLEKLVLARAIWCHLNRKVLVHKNRTVIFQ